MKRILLFFIFITCFVMSGLAQYPVIDYVQAEVDFSKKLRDWDGFGINYVETCQTSNFY